jgi:hypothetical protein
MTPCGLIGKHQCFGETYCLHLQDWGWRQYVPPKRWYLPTSPHGISTQKNNIDIFTAVRTSNLAQVREIEHDSVFLLLCLTSHRAWWLWVMSWEIFGSGRGLFCGTEYLYGQAEGNQKLTVRKRFEHRTFYVRHCVCFCGECDEPYLTSLYVFLNPSFHYCYGNFSAHWKCPLTVDR